MTDFIAYLHALNFLLEQVEESVTSRTKEE